MKVWLCYAVSIEDGTLLKTVSTGNEGLVDLYLETLLEAYSPCKVAVRCVVSRTKFEVLYATTERPGNAE